VLFAWAGDVEKGEHRSALYDALEPWLGPTTDGLVPDLSPVMTELGKASLQAIATACEQAFAAGWPYSHIHLLAHGAPLPSSIPELTPFGVALEDGDVTAEQLASAIRAGAPGGPTVVTLASCDSSNAAQTLLARGRVAYELHARGVPVVIGSQLPLTQVGAAAFARTFYKGILAETQDIRLVLCDARVELKKNPEAWHDWASITAHLRLPEGYAAELHAAQLVVEFAKMNTAGRWAQRIVEGKVEATPAQAERIERLLQDRIAALVGKIRGSELRGQEATLENLGLLASCYKRLAELVFFRSPNESSANRSRELLEQSRERYFRAHESALSHHWTGTQHLALAAVTSGSIPEENTLHFQASVHAAKLDAQLNPEVDPATRSRVIWALGSLAELGLLARVSAHPVKSKVSARAALDQLIALATKEPQKQDALESTWRQLRRYVHWWTRAHGFFPSAEHDLNEPAQELVSAIEPYVAAARAPT
jgi:CHAT domain-containing protein/tetratricopeptide repeat protein